MTGDIVWVVDSESMGKTCVFEDYDKARAYFERICEKFKKWLIGEDHHFPPCIIRYYKNEDNSDGFAVSIECYQVE